MFNFAEKYENKNTKGHWTGHTILKSNFLITKQLLKCFHIVSLKQKQDKKKKKTQPENKLVLVEKILITGDHITLPQ